MTHRRTTPTELADTLDCPGGSMGVLGRAIDSEPRGLVVRALRNHAELDIVHRLVHDVYVAAGYVAPQPGARLIYCPRLDLAPETTVFLALIGGRAFGTVSLTLDGPAGFHLDEEYPREAAAIRRERRSLASAWRLAVRPPEGARLGVLMKLLSAIREPVLAGSVETCLFTVVPGFELAYCRLFGARRVAASSLDRGCASAALSMFRIPTVLMRWDVERCPERWLHEAAA